MISKLYIQFQNFFTNPLTYDHITDKERADRDLAYSLGLLSQISKKDESVPGKTFNFGREVINANRIIRHREKEYVENGLVGI